MKDTAPQVIVIPAKPELANKWSSHRQLRVAAYCRVSTKSEEQLTSYEAQKQYYTDKIMGNKEWTMVDIFADEGLTGTSAKKRPEFLRMIRMCKQGKIDLILTKSISRFARNTVDCLNHTRLLKSMGIGVYFEEHNINSLDDNSELFITMYGAHAQAESENISANVRWGKRHAMKNGRVIIEYKKLYAYEKGEDGKPRIIPEQAEIVREIYRQYLAGASVAMIQRWLHENNIPNAAGETKWTEPVVRNILKNEKYCGDVLMQKTFVTDCIEGKTLPNTGQLPMYLIQDHHPAIVERKVYQAVQAEMARRVAGRSPSKKHAPTGRSCYSSKYALTERLVCGECGTLYRRCTWKQKGQKRIVWRCVSRLDYGKKYCKNSPTIDEEPLQRAILAAINSAMSNKSALIKQITGAMTMELITAPGATMSLTDIERRIEEINNRTHEIIVETVAENDEDKYTDELKALLDEMAFLKETRSSIEEQHQSNTAATHRIESAAAIMEQASAELTEWDEGTIRQLVDMVKVISKDKIIVYLCGGTVIEQDMVE